MADVSVFAVEDTSAQVHWRGLPPGTTIAMADASAEVVHDGPGAATFDGLAPGVTVEVTVKEPGKPSHSAGSVKTLRPPPGDLLCRFATVNDTHVGERRFGLTQRMRDPGGNGVEPYALRCARAAVTEAVAWGAEALLAKGDLTYTGRPQQWADLVDVLGGAGVPVAAVLGNHDVGRKAVDGRPVLAGGGITVPHEPFTLELPGLRVVLAHTSIPHKGEGTFPGPQRDAVAELLAGAGGPAFLAMHHYLQRFRRPLTYPPGIPGDEATALLDTVAEVNPATFVSSGHSHRHRLRRHGPLVITQIGATMHYPGTWAGYAVHEGGIRQVVRRVAAPAAIAWTDRTRRALLGGWPLVSEGRLHHRCFSHPWPSR